MRRLVSVMERPGACLLCDSSGDPAVLADDGYQGRLCNCGVIYIDPLPDVAIDPTVDAHLESYYALPAKLRMDWAARFASGGAFLEVGCGTGRLVAEALGRGFEVSAIEPNAACAELVSRRYGVQVERALVEQSRLPRERFAIVFHVDLLSHFPDPVGALRAMANLLRRDGTMCFEVGLFGGLAPAWYPWIGRPGFPAHRWFFSEDAVRRLLRRAGLATVALETFAIAPSTVLSTVLRRAMPRLRSVTIDPTGAPATGTRIQRLYARLHYVLRYQIGKVLALPGPRTALVAARLIGADVGPATATT